MVEPQLPIEEALAVLQFGPDELICEGSGSKTLLVYDGEQMIVTR